MSACPPQLETPQPKPPTRPLRSQRQRGKRIRLLYLKHHLGEAKHHLKAEITSRHFRNNKLNTKCNLNFSSYRVNLRTNAPTLKGPPQQTQETAQKRASPPREQENMQTHATPPPAALAISQFKSPRTSTSRVSVRASCSPMPPASKTPASCFPISDADTAAAAAATTEVPKNRPANTPTPQPSSSPAAASFVSSIFTRRIPPSEMPLGTPNRSSSSSSSSTISGAREDVNSSFSMAPQQNLKTPEVPRQGFILGETSARPLCAFLASPAAPRRHPRMRSSTRAANSSTQGPPPSLSPSPHRVANFPCVS